MLLKKRKSIVPKLIDLSLVLLLLHLLFEVTRWLLFPIYVVVVTSIFWVKPKSKWIGFGLNAILLLTLVLSMGLSYVFPLFKLPETTGAFGVATEKIELTSKGYPLRIWYPVKQENQNQEKGVYYETFGSKNDILGIPSFLFHYLNQVGTNASKKSTITNEKFPLLVYAQGFNSIMVDNTALIEEIVSHGYIVVAAEKNFILNNYGIEKDSLRVVNAEIQKELIKKLIDVVSPDLVFFYKEILTVLGRTNTRFAHHLDFDTIGFIGHSLGGTVMTSLGKQVTNAKAVINIDGPIDNQVLNEYSKPFLYISSFSPDLSDDELISKKIPVDFYRNVKSYELEAVELFFKSNMNDSYWVRFKHASHLDLTDMPFVIPLLKSKGYDKQLGHKIKSELIVNFLDKFLKKSEKTLVTKNKEIEWLKH
ncbi:MAG: hypothetical protein AAGA43_04945 [Bacteroidota bacterium]